jgi:hypothetical protein
VGFSGTNDNYRLLPLNIIQHQPRKEEGPSHHAMLATNGKMVDLMIRKSTVQVLPTSSTWRDLIESSVKSGGRALIDAGGLLAGATNAEVAEFLLQCLPKNAKFQGVVFFDERQWSVLQRSGRKLPLNQSPVRECECFALFDEARCRGADLKLAHDAMAILTLGPKCCKDKLMQAAGRMRQLDSGQSLMLVALEDIARQMKVERRARITAKEVLLWAIRNTVDATITGYPEWAKQGTYFATTKAVPEEFSRQLPELVELGEMYGGRLGIQTVAQVSTSAQDFLLGRCKGGDAVEGLSMVPKGIEHDFLYVIREQVEQYGAQYNIVSTGLEEECERELEVEVEEEEELERAVARVRATGEVAWNYEAILKASCVAELQARAPALKVQTLSSAMNHLSCPSLSLVSWNLHNVFVTDNFLCGVSQTLLDDFLRPVDAVLCLGGADFLIISEREVNQILPLLWRGDAGVELFHLPLLKPAVLGIRDSISAAVTGIYRSISSSSSGIQRMPPPLQPARALPDTIVTLLELFNGSTMFSTESQRSALRRLLPSNGAASDAPLKLVEMRGNLQRFPYSDLETVSNSIVRQAEHVKARNIDFERQQK